MAGKPTYDVLVQRVNKLEKEAVEHKRAEEASRESEQLQKGIIQLTPDMIFRFNRDRVYTYFKAPTDFSNHIPGNLTGKNMHHLMPKELIDERMKLAQKVWEIGEPIEHEFQFVVDDVKRYRWAKYVRWNDDEILASVRDITDRKQAEEALRESEKKFSKLFHANPVYTVFTTFEDGRFLEVNDAFVKITGYGREEVIGRTTTGIGLWANPEERVRLVKLGKEKGRFRDQRVEFLKKNGEPLIMLWSAERSGIGGEDCLISALVDITAIEKAEKRLRESEELYRSVVEQVSEGIVLLNFNTKEIQESNKAFRNMLGYTSKEMSRLTLYDFIAHEKEDIDSNIHHIVKEEDYFIGERKYRNKDGALLDVEVSASQISFGEKDALCAVVRDISDRKRAEESLKKAHDELEARVAKRTAELSEANEQLGLEIEERKRAEEQSKLSLKEKKVLLAEIHHRVKNNLQVVSSLLGMTRTRTDNPEAVELLSRAQSRVFTMALIHSQLYENDRFTDIDMGKHARQLILHLTEIYGKEKDITPVIRASDITLSLTYAVPCAMVLNELIANVFKHAYQEGEEGTIEVAMERSPDDKFSLMVKDYGVGVPEEADIDEATCLGLKLAKNLVRRQLKGHFQMKGDNGTEVLVDFQLLREE